MRDGRGATTCASVASAKRARASCMIVLAIQRIPNGSAATTSSLVIASTKAVACDERREERRGEERRGEMRDER